MSGDINSQFQGNSPRVPTDLTNSTGSIQEQQKTTGTFTGQRRVSTEFPNGSPVSIPLPEGNQRNSPPINQNVTLLNTDSPTRNSKRHILKILGKKIHNAAKKFGKGFRNLFKTKSSGAITRKTTEHSALDNAIKDAENLNLEFLKDVNQNLKTERVETFLNDLCALRDNFKGDDLEEFDKKVLEILKFIPASIFHPESNVFKKAQSSEFIKVFKNEIEKHFGSGEELEVFNQVVNESAPNLRDWNFESMSEELKKVKENVQQIVSFAHTFGLDGKLQFDDVYHIELEGFHKEKASMEIVQSLKTFTSNRDQNAINSAVFEEIATQFENAAQPPKGEEILNNINAGKDVVILRDIPIEGGGSHATAWVISNNGKTVHICNKGYDISNLGEYIQNSNKESSGVTTFSTPKGFSWDEQKINKLTESQGTPGSKLAKEWGFQYETTLHGKPQKVGNCTRASTKNAVRALLLSHLMKEFKDTYSDPQEAMEAAKPAADSLYKEWASHFRDEELGKLFSEKTGMQDKHRLDLLFRIVGKRSSSMKGDKARREKIKNYIFDRLKNNPESLNQWIDSIEDLQRKNKIIYTILGWTMDQPNFQQAFASRHGIWSNQENELEDNVTEYDSDYLDMDNITEYDDDYL